MVWQLRKVTEEKVVAIAYQYLYLSTAPRLMGWIWEPRIVGLLHPIVHHQDIPHGLWPTTTYRLDA